MEDAAEPTRRLGSRPRYFSVAVDRSGERTVLHLEGELDLGSSPQLEAAIARVLQAGTAAVVVDVRGLRFVDMAGLRVLLAGQERAEREGRRLVLSGMREPIRRVLALAQVTDVLDVV